MTEYVRLDQSQIGRPRPGGLGVGRLLLGVGAVVALLAVLVVVQIERGTQPIKATLVLPKAITVAGHAPTLPWPKHATAAAAIQGVGSLGGVRADRVRSLASVAKLFTALVVLKEHPLRPGQSGPTLTVTPADVSKYRLDVRNHDSVVKVTAGEHLTELQALQGMLVPSADNLARLLANWSSGSRASFVHAMNSEATALGLRQTHLAGPSGLNPHSVGTASDLVKVGEAVMASPVLRQIVSMPQVTLPSAGTVYNFNNVIGRDGIVGIKTGSTLQSGGNFVFAATRNVQGKNVMVIGAVLGSTGVDALQNALNTGAKLARVALRAVRRVPVLSTGEAVMKLHAAWGPTVIARTTGSIRLLAVPGEAIRARVVLMSALARGRLHHIAAGERVATVELQVNGHTTRLPVTATGAIATPSLAYKLERF
ncbi:MAG: D-alanyl-D-alanine carboxypeptidase family protein [Solirubrobacteraceae bacterium]